MRQLAVFVSLAFSAGLPALALDVSGKVYDKLVNPVPGAKACVKGDPGPGLITGTWPSTAAFKAPTLRNLAARPPYFHDGSAATLAEVVEHYRQEMGFQFTDPEMQDLINYMKAL